MPREYAAYLTPSLRAIVTSRRFMARYCPESFTYADLSSLVAMEAELAARELGL